MEMGPWLRVSPEILEEPGIKLGIRVHKASGLSTTPRQLVL